MRIVIHDPPGHPFPVQLSRELARRGHDVLHIYSPFFGRVRGDLVRHAADPARFEVEALNLAETYTKHAYIRRRFQEIAYGKVAARRALAYGPEVVMSADTPLDAQARLLEDCRRARIGFVFWLQDLYSVAIDRNISKQVPLVGGLIGAHYMRLERRLLRSSQEVVAISSDFVTELQRWGIAGDRVHVIENWAPFSELSVAGQHVWAAKNGLRDKRYVLYAGTLGLKHNPGLLLELAVALRRIEGVQVVVASEGRGADWLAQQARDRPLPNLVVLPFQPYDEIGDMMTGAEVLIAFLEPDASSFSVPSKVLTYLCAGRPIVAAIPAENLAARALNASGAGVVVPASSGRALIDAAEMLLRDPELRSRMGRSAREYASHTFDIQRIADEFERVLVRAAS